MNKVEVKAKGIKNRLKSVKPYRAIAEYIWNGFDAGANTVDITFEINDLGNINYLSVKDNGSGIPYNLLDSKFKPVLSSEKHESELQHTLVQGKNGLGRLTFYHFSESVEWQTCYEANGKYYEYVISTNESSIDQYSSSKHQESNIESIGTNVVFKNIFGLSEYYVKDILISYLSKEFAWFLELMKEWGRTININGEALPYTHLIKDMENFEFSFDGKTFEIQYVRWANRLNKHFSRYYCIDTSGKFKYSKPTTLNNKGDKFYHSIFVKDEYFDTFKCEKKECQGDFLSSNTDKSDDFKALISNINSYLRDKRKPFIVNYAKSLVEEYEKKGVFPEFNAKTDGRLCAVKILRKL